MTMTFEDSHKGRVVEFGLMDKGDCFVNSEGDYCMKIEDTDEGNCVVLIGASAGIVLSSLKESLVKKISLIVRVGGV